MPSETKCPLFAELGTPELSSAEIFVCGASAGILAAVVTQPADVVKTRLQLYPHKYSGNGDALVSIVKVIISLSRKTLYIVARMFLQLKHKSCLPNSEERWCVTCKFLVLVFHCDNFLWLLTFCESILLWQTPSDGSKQGFTLSSVLCPMSHFCLCHKYKSAQGC